MTGFDWRTLAMLDVDADVCFAVYDLFRVQVKESCSNLARMLDPVSELSIARRLRAVLDDAPQVMTGAAGFLWLNSVYAALSRDDVASVLALQEDLVRFEIASAMLCGADLNADVAPGDWLALPGAGVALRTATGRVQVRAGEAMADITSHPRVGSLVVDEYESLFRSPRSASQFELAPPGVVRTAVRELERANEMSDRIFPGIFDRYMTTVVPLMHQPGRADAGTDDAAPFVMYASFDREPSDLLAAMAHEESHQLLQTLEKLQPDLLPNSEGDMPVPWKLGQRRRLPNVIHGLVAFGRAAAVRSRADRAGHGSTANSKALERERGWVASVSDELRAGVLGALPEGLEEWLDANLAQIDAPLPGAEVTAEVAGLGVPSTSFPWALLSGGAGRAAAAALYPRLADGFWPRGNVGYPNQDSRPATDAVRAHPDSKRFFETIAPQLVQGTFGRDVVLAAAKAHRLRPGDRIPLHSDEGHPEFRYRVVLGVSPLHHGSGELGIYDRARTLLFRLQPDFGSALLFEMVEGSYHDVSVNQSAHDRLTVIASYALAD